MAYKGTMINIASVYTFLGIPGIIFYRELTKNILIGWVIMVLLALITPPFGYMKPHKYSDFPGNRSE